MPLIRTNPPAMASAPAVASLPVDMPVRGRVPGGVSEGGTVVVTTGAMVTTVSAATVNAALLTCVPPCWPGPTTSIW